jgi:hypothetical protein
MHSSKCRAHGQYRDEIITKEFLLDNYINQNLSIDEIINKLNNKFSSSEIEMYMKKFEIGTRICKCGEICIEGVSYGSHIGHCKVYKDYKNNILSEEFLLENYINKRYPCGYISELLKNEFTAHEIKMNLKKFNIKIRTNSENISTDFVQNKLKTTMLEKYGVENCSQSEEVKQKKVDTMMDNFGVSHHLKLESQMDKQRQTNLDRYGKDNVSQVKEIHLLKESTFQENYGVRNIFCDAQMMKQYWMDKFGVDNPSKVLEVELKKQDTIFKNFGLLTTRYPASKNSQILFDKIYKNLTESIKPFCYYYNLNKEP